MTYVTSPGQCAGRWVLPAGSWIEVSDAYGHPEATEYSLDLHRL